MICNYLVIRKKINRLVSQMEHFRKKDDDRRNFPRIPKNVSVEVDNLSYVPPERKSETGITKNISGSGMCLTVSAPYEPKTLLGLKFSMPIRENHKKVFSDWNTSPRSLTTVGEVAWCVKRPGRSEYELGIEFKPRTFADAKRLYSILHRIL